MNEFFKEDGVQRCGEKWQNVPGDRAAREGPGAGITLCQGPEAGSPGALVAGQQPRSPWSLRLVGGGGGELQVPKSLHLESR